MNLSIASADQQQLIPMSTLPIAEEKTHLRQSQAELKQQTFFLRLFTCPIHCLTSMETPRFSDRSLRLIFLFFILLIGLTSFTSALIVGSSYVQFKEKCPLYASFRFETLTHNEKNWTVRILPLSERFSSQSTCDFCTFYNVFTFIYCIITGFFFVLFNGDHRIVTSNDRCLIIPWFPFSLILALLALINASILTNGFLKFCSTILSNDSSIVSCTQLNQLVFDQYPNVSWFFFSMLTAIIASWFQLAFFIGILAILTIRLASSFDWTRTEKN